MQQDLQNFLRSLYDAFMQHYSRQDYHAAADYLLAILQDAQPHPVVFLPYQLPSLEHFLRVTATPSHPMSFEVFELLLKNLIAAAQKGSLPDTRVVEN